jgi:hypothetical protein
VPSPLLIGFTDDGLENRPDSVTVGVPHARKDAPIDEGQADDSTGS